MQIFIQISSRFKVNAVNEISIFNIFSKVTLTSDIENLFWFMTHHLKVIHVHTNFDPSIGHCLKQLWHRNKISVFSK